MKAGAHAESERFSASGRERYRVLGKLGEGGMGEVRLVVSFGAANLPKLLVRKSLRSDLLRDADAVAMFLDEARIAARLNHPNVVQTYDVEEELGVPVIVMEYLDGQPLSDVLARVRKENRRFPLGMHLRIIADALAGLHYAHELADFDGSTLALVHRDVSPHNLFVSYEGQTKVLDFGIAKAIGATTKTQSGLIKGKVAYMAPEQMAGERVDRRADIFAVGVILWEAIVGRRLWGEDWDVSIMHKVTNGQLPTPRSANPDVSEELERICMKAMSPAAEKRYATAAELEAEIERVLDEDDRIGGRVKPREIGRFVAELFDEERAETRALIESHLGRPSSSSNPSVAAQSQNTSTPSMPNGSTGTWHEHPVTKSAKVVRPARTRVGGILAIAAVIAGAGSFYVASRGPRVAPPPNVAAEQPSVVALAPASAPAPAAAVEEERVTIKIAVTPREAKVYFDDELLPTNPSIKSLARSTAWHKVRAEAPGHAPRELDVTLEKSAKVAFALEALKAPPRRAAPAPAPAPAAASAAPNCALPFYVDESGVRRVKKECM